MKKKILLLILFCFSFLFVFKTGSALESTVNLNCESLTLKADEQTTCEISVSVTTGSLSAFVGKISLSDNLTLVSSNISETWSGSATSGNFQLSTSTPKTGTVSIGTISVKVNTGIVDTTEQIKLTNIVLDDELTTEYNVSDVVREIQVPRQLSNNANLENLSISVGTLSPSFDPNITEYIVDNVNSDTIDIIATEASNTSITGADRKNLNYGTNSFQITVRAEAGNTKKYKIIVNRVDSRSSDSSLKSLIVNERAVELSSSQKKYQMELPNTETSLTVSAQANDSKASIRYSSNNVSLSLNETYTVYIYVTAENGTMSTYSVTATRKDNRSSNNNLKILKINDKNITLNSNQSYTLTVDNNVTLANVIAVAEDTKATVTVNGNKNLKTGNNIFTIIVTAENTAIKTYKLTVIRKNSDGDITNLSNNSDLKSLKIENVAISFVKNKLEYSFDVENDITKLKISYELDDPKSSAVIEGNDDLQVGLNTIKILVTAENGESSTYLLKVTRKAKNYEVENNTNSIIQALEDKKSYEEVIVKVNSNDSLLIPNNIIQKLVDSKKKITYKFIEDNFETYSIILNGKLFNTYDKDINYNLTFTSENNVLLEKIGTRKHIILNFKHNTEVPAGTIFNIYVGNTYDDNSSLYLYQYNSETANLELSRENLVVENGYVDIDLNYLTEYVVLDSKIIDNANAVVPDQNINASGPNTLLYIIGGSLLIILIVVITLIFIIRKKKKTTNKEKIAPSSNATTNLIPDSNDINQQPIVIPETTNINSSVANNAQTFSISELSNVSANNDDIDLIDIEEDNPSPKTEYLLGISAMDIDDYLEKCPLADLKNSNVKDGIVIVGFEPNSSVEKAGLRQGDVLLTLNKEKIVNKEQFRNLISNVKNGQEVLFNYYRNGVTNEIKILL